MESKDKSQDNCVGGWMSNQSFGSLKDQQVSLFFRNVSELMIKFLYSFEMYQNLWLDHKKPYWPCKKSNVLHEQK